jgi:acetyl-CoA carboxylase carboxyl transferase subunit beta
VVGEKIARTIEAAAEEKLPLLIVSCSGGARMQESALSLMQMAKTSAALARLDDAKQLFISLLADPTTGGVTASFAMLGDFIIAEPKALIGFAGPRTIWNTIKVELPEGFQRSEFLQEHGFVDFVVHRKDLRSEIARLMDYCAK